MSEEWKNHLRTAIKDRGTTMHAVSQAIGKNKHYVTQLLNKDRSPSVKTLEPIADVLGLTVIDLLEGPGVETDARRIAADIEKLPPREREYVVSLIRKMQEGVNDGADGEAVASAEAGNS